MDLPLIAVVVIATALFFDFTNGFHDTANAMATPIATGALRPRLAVVLAALLNLAGVFLSAQVGWWRVGCSTPLDVAAWKRRSRRLLVTTNTEGSAIASGIAPTL